MGNQLLKTVVHYFWSLQTDMDETSLEAICKIHTRIQIVLIPTFIRWSILTVVCVVYLSVFNTPFPQLNYRQVMCTSHMFLRVIIWLIRLTGLTKAVGG